MTASSDLTADITWTLDRQSKTRYRSLIVLRGQLMDGLAQVLPNILYEEALSAWKSRLADRQNHLWGLVRESGAQRRCHLSERATYVCAEALEWVTRLPACSIHAIVTDPPYGLLEYDEEHLRKKKIGSGGIWRIPPAFDGIKRSPLPRFTVLSSSDLQRLEAFFSTIASEAIRVLVPGGHVFVASNPLLSTVCFYAFQGSGFEKRGEIIRQVQTLRGGYKPKGAEDEFPEVSVMPRSCWEPWGIFRKPTEGTVANNLKKWGTGGLRRASRSQPVKDLIVSSPARGGERAAAPHPSLKPQKFIRQIVRAALPLGLGIIFDPFAGSGSTLAAAEALGYRAIGTDRSGEYFDMARQAFAVLSGATLVQ